ncbi:MAG: hypothetical protein Q7T49_02605 [bacterium]|nr:hypothetical protein [bacterium]
MKFGKIIKIVSIIVGLVLVALISYNLYFIDWFDGNSNLGADKSLAQDNYSVREEPATGEVMIISTADPKWNLYRNFKYGFQIQYPAEWEFIKIYKTDDGTGDVFIGFSPSGEDSQIVLNIYHDIDIDSYINKFESSNLIKYEKLRINDKDMFMISKTDSDYAHRGYVLIDGNITYSIGGGGDPETFWYIDRMIETLEVF